MPDNRFLTAHIDLPFLRELFKHKPEDLAATPENEWPEVWQNVYRFLQRSAQVVIGAERDTIKSTPTLTRLLFGTGQTEHVTPKPNLSEAYRNPDDVVPNPYSVFLLEDPEVPVVDLRERKGLLFLRHEDLETDWLRLFDEHVINVLPETEPNFDWEDLRPHSIPLNAVVISDKFAYKQFVEKPFEPNLGALLRSILPEGPLDLPVHVTLITDLQTPYENQGPTPNEIHDRLRAKIESYRPELEVRTTVVSHEIGSGHKDRYIFTNYGFFSSNDSLSFYEKEGLRKDTIVFYSPYSTQGSSTARPRLQRLHQLCSDPVEYYGTVRKGDTGSILLASGDNRNRLLKAVT